MSTLKNVSDPNKIGLRSGALGIGHNGFGYIGFGYKPSGATVEFIADLWRFDPATNKLTRIWDGRNGPSPRWGAVGFGVRCFGKDYLIVLTGYQSNGYVKDIWEYDIAEKLWTKLGDAPFHERRLAIGFSIEQKGYAGLGMGNKTVTDEQLFADFWEFDANKYYKDFQKTFGEVRHPIGNYWKKLTDFGGGQRYAAIGFNRAKTIYVGCGFSTLQGNSGKLDFYRYSGGIWERIKAIVPKGGDTGPYAEGIGFGIGAGGNDAFIGFGGSHSHELYKYEDGLITEKWKNVIPTILPATTPAPIGRNQAVGFSILVGGIIRGYIGWGSKGNAISDYFDDLWELS